jgi:hypothetical protein
VSVNKGKVFERHPDSGDQTCELCFPDHVLLGQIGSMQVILYQKMVRVVTSPHHRSDVILRLKNPRPDPVTPEMEAQIENAVRDPLLPALRESTEEIEEGLWEESAKWLENVEKETSHLAATLGIMGCTRFVADLKKVGWNQPEHGFPELFVYTKCAEFHQAYKKKQKKARKKNATP